MNHDLTYRQIFLRWHTTKANELREQLDRTACPVERAMLQYRLDRHVVAIRQLDNAAVTSDAATL